MKAESSANSPWYFRDFRILFAVHTTGLLGAGLSAVALALLAYQLAGASASAVLGWALTIRITVIVFVSPWAGVVAAWLGPRKCMIAADFFRAGIVVGFLFVTEVWQIYLLAVFLHLGAAVFTPVYKSTIPGVVGPASYPKALAWGVTAYDSANILGPVLAALVIATFGFQANFLLNSAAFLLSGILLFGISRTASARGDTQTGNRPRGSALGGIRAMLGRWPLRISLLFALQASIAGAFVLVASIHVVKVEWGADDTLYAWLMAASGIGSVCGAMGYAKFQGIRRTLLITAGPAMLVGLLLAAGFPFLRVLLPAWAFLGAGMAILGIRGNELLAANSGPEERADVFAAHFSLSHVGWGLAYPLAGILAAVLGFPVSAWIFAAAFFVVSIPLWIYWLWMAWLHRGNPNATHEHCDGPDQSPSHLHRHGSLEHRHWHIHF